MSKDVVFDSIERMRGAWVVRGRVRSRSRPGTWHSVEVRIRWVDGEVVVRGRCDCEAFVKGHMICWHILHLTNVFIRNRRRLARSLASTN